MKNWWATNKKMNQSGLKGVGIIADFTYLWHNESQVSNYLGVDYHFY